MIDPGLIKYLDDETQTRLRAFEHLFETQGWKLFSEFIEYQLELKKHQLMHATSWEENRVAFGNLGVLTDIFKLPESTAAEFEAMALAAQESAEEEVIEGELEYE